MAFKRAGADGILTCFALDAAEALGAAKPSRQFASKRVRKNAEVFALAGAAPARLRENLALGAGQPGLGRGRQEVKHDHCCAPLGPVAPRRIRYGRTASTAYHIAAQRLWGSKIPRRV